MTHLKIRVGLLVVEVRLSFSDFHISNKLLKSLTNFILHIDNDVLISTLHQDSLDDIVSKGILDQNFEGFSLVQLFRVLNNGFL